MKTINTLIKFVQCAAVLGYSGFFMLQTVWGYKCTLESLIETFKGYIF